MIQAPDREPPPDEHLRAALRHAPDAALGAPADLGAQIRAAAWRAATAAPMSVPNTPMTWTQRLWSWLGRPGRMGASGAFATVLIAGVIGLVWRGEAPPAVEPTRPVGLPQPSAPAQAQAPAAAAAPRAAPAPPSDRREAKAKPAERVAEAMPAAPSPAAPLPAEPLAVRSRADSRDSALPRIVASPAVVQRGSNAAAEGAARAFAKPAAAAPASAVPDFAAWLEEDAARSDATPLLTELLAMTRGRWQASEAPPPALGDESRFEVKLAGRPPALITLSDDALWACPTTTPQRCQRATLSADQSARLRELSMAAPRR